MKTVLEWNVFRHEFNKKKIYIYNIFEHYGFLVDCFEIYKEYQDDHDEFKEKIRRALMYYFWAKCEHEVIISEWPPATKEKNQVREKVDIYQQVSLNFDLFIEYTYKTMHQIVSVNKLDSVDKYLKSIGE